MRSSLLTVLLLLSTALVAQTTFMRTMQLPWPAQISGSDATADGGVVMCGSANVNNDQQGVLIRTDANGTVLWTRTYDTQVVDIGVFNYQHVWFMDVAAATDSTYWVAGQMVDSTGMWGATLVALFNEQGDTLGSKRVNTPRVHYTKAVARGNGAVLVGGYYTGSIQTWAIAVALDANALESGTGFRFDEGASEHLSGIAPLLNGDVLLSGDDFFARTDDTLGMLWNLPLDEAGVVWGGSLAAEFPDSTLVMVGAGTPAGLAKRTSDGTLIWSQALDCAGGFLPKAIKALPDGRILLGGNSSAPTPFAWLARFSATGALEWAYKYGTAPDALTVEDMHWSSTTGHITLTGNLGVDKPFVIQVDSTGNGACSSTALSVTTVPASPSTFVSGTHYPSGGIGGTGLRTMATTSYLLAGSYCPSDISAFHAKGFIFHDIDLDGQVDPGEPPLPWVPYVVTPANGFTYADGAGHYDLNALSTGTYTIAAPLPAPWFQQTTNPADHTVTFTAADTLFEDLDFGFAAAYDTTLLVGSFSSKALRVHAMVHQYIHILNNGSTTPQGEAHLVLDTALQFISSVPPPDAIIGDTLIWNFDSLALGSTWNAELTVQVPGPWALHEWLGGNLDVYSDDGLGTLTLRDTDAWSGIVEYSFDPNDKQVSPAGTGPNNATPGDTEWLTYTIRFQNTGTDTAYTVLIEDQLSQHLQRNTFQMIGASHDLSGLGIGASGKVSFTFNNIMLPDSNVNELGSHGVVQYRIKPQPGLQHLTIIENNAGIFFDLNPPVITNSTMNTMVDCATATFWPITVVDYLGNNELWGYTNAQNDPNTYTYQWYVDGVMIPGASGTYIPGGVAWVTAVVSGNYTVALTDGYGCTSTSDPFPFIPMDIPENDAMRMAAFPNPFDAATAIMYTEVLDASTRIELIDLHGRVVRTLQGNGTREVTLERGALQSGLYMVRVLDAHGQRAAVRVVVQ
jgi:uncharacterized repeat protein (TIGR01451 family)